MKDEKYQETLEILYLTAAVMRYQQRTVDHQVSNSVQSCYLQEDSCLANSTTLAGFYAGCYVPVFRMHIQHILKV